MPHSGDGIRLRSSARTSVGQVRENNEDSVHLWPGDQFVLAVVADGMGGAAAGEEASRMAIEAIQAGMSLRNRDTYEAINGLSDDLVADRLRTSIEQANLSIMQRSIDEPDLRGMGTTVTLAFVRGIEVIIAHVGDSRAYQVDGATTRIRQITSDHSFVEALLSAGHITPEQAEDHPMRNVLYRALGQAEELDVDIYKTRLEIGDRLVLCSDGLTRHVKPDEIAQLSLSDENPSKASQKLIDLANERGGEDNVSVIIVSVERDNSNPEADMKSDFAAEDEDTLVLKDKPFSRSALQIQPDPSPAKSQDDPSQDSDPESRTSSYFSKHKMQAERVSDSDDLPPKNCPARSTVLQFPSPDRITIPADGETQPEGRPGEGDGEGHDTRAPEQ
ncbi:MAG: Stp1/IreP family PP2C-type Ser/Thr phosphatase [Anaerolineae bacterium]|nr:Stp1/IreP family PP2C-type Ser/Thr phosphatase [Anaerolineae bacterium]